MPMRMDVLGPNKHAPMQLQETALTVWCMSPLSPLFHYPLFLNYLAFIFLFFFPPNHPAVMLMRMTVLGMNIHAYKLQSGLKSA